MTVSAQPNGPGESRERPQGLFRITGATIAAVDWAGRVICAATLAAMFAALLVNVILRYVAASGITWAYEIHTLLLPWLVAGGVLIAAAASRHIAVTLLPAMVTGMARRSIYALVHLFTAAIAIAILWSSLPILHAAQYQTLSTLGITQYWGYLSIPVAFGGVGLIAILDLVRLAAGAVEADADPSINSLS